MSERTRTPGYDRELRHRIASEVIAHYGGRCACCGTEEDLSIDHRNGNGTEHRRELFGYPYAGYRFYLWLKRNGYPDGYQVLCTPCNRSKGRNEHCHIAHGRPGFKWCSHRQHAGDEPLPLQDFARNPTTIDGRRSFCKNCIRQFVTPNERNR